MRRGLRRAVLAWCLIGLVLGPGLAGAQSVGPLLQTEGVDPDNIALRATVTDDGNARWAIEYSVRLDDDNETAAFEDLQSDIAANESEYRDQFERRMRPTVRTAENSTSREMAIRNVSVTAEKRQLPQQFGVVRYSFEWIGFAAVDGDRLLIGDVLEGLFLGENTRLVVSWPTDYEVRELAPEPDNRGESSATWFGPREFGRGEPHVVVAPASPLPVSGWSLGLVAVVVAGLGASWWYRDRLPRLSRTVRTDRAETEGVDAPPVDEGDGDEAAEASSEALLSPEERVVRLLEERGGRMRQQEVVSEFDWTAARTSQVVGKLRDEGTIETFRLGRENVLTFSDEAEQDA